MPGEAVGESSGPAVDRQGAPVIDPTKNVLDLVEAGNKRQDDLRNLETAHVREILQMRAEHFKEIREAETNRIDAIRAVDVGNVSRAAEVAATQAQTLAAQVATSAETLRTQVQASATASQIALAAALEPVQKDIADLRRAQYEAQGVKAQTGEGRGGAALVIAGIAVVMTFLSLVATVVLGVVLR
jgi:hypothetical protein